MYRYADPIAGRHEAHLRKATRSGVKPARAKEQVNEIAEATQQITKSGRSHLLYNDNKIYTSCEVGATPIRWDIRFMLLKHLSTYNNNQNYK